MKRLCSLLLIPFILFLTSCTNVHVSYQLSNDNIASLDYSLEIEPNEESIKGYMNTINDYWQSMDFATTLDIENDAYILSGKKTLSSDTKELAAEKFSALLTEDGSLFYDVNFEYLPSYEMDEYSLAANVSLENIIRQNQIQNIPEDETKKLQNGAKSGEYKVSISLPGEVMSSNSDEQNGQICTWYLEFDEARNIQMKTKKSNEENIEYFARLKDNFENESMLFNILGIVGVALILVIILALIVRHTHKKKLSKPCEKQRR